MSKFLCLNGVNSNKNGVSIRQPIMKWILILLLCVQLASIVSNLIVSSLLDGSGLLDLSYYPHSPTLNTDGTSDSVILESNLFLSLMNGTEYHGVDIYTLYTTTRQRLTKNRNSLFRAVRRQSQEEQVNDVTSFQYSIGIEPCKIIDNRFTKSLFIGVVSAPQNFKRRRDIRRTWFKHINDARMTQIKNSVNIVGFGFILGQTTDAYVQALIEDESRTHGDVLQVQIMDNYFELAVKGVAFFNWLNNNCARVDFVLKVDDDVYVNIRQLSSLLTRPPFTTSSFLSDIKLYGFNETLAEPKRNESKWDVSWALWPWKTYPLYLFGASILIPGGEGVRRLLEAAKTTPYYRIDDVYLNGLLPEKAKMNLSHVNRFYCPSAPEEPSECYARWAATWLTESSWHMRASHTAVERLHLHNQNRERCNWTMTTGCNSFQKEKMPKIADLLVDGELFFGLMAKYDLAEAKIVNLSLALQNCSGAPSTLTSPAKGFYKKNELL